MGKRIVRRFFSCLSVVLLVLSMTACGDTKEPEGRDNRKASSTPSPAGEDTPTPEATPSDGPEATPTDMPEATPTDAPEVTPTEVPEVTPTEAPEVTPTETPEITPTTAPEITPTAIAHGIHPGIAAEHDARADGDTRRDTDSSGRKTCGCGEGRSPVCHRYGLLYGRA